MIFKSSVLPRLYFMADMAHLSDFSEWEDFPLFAPPGTEIPRLEEDSSEGVSNAIGALSHLLYDEETPQEASELLRDEGNRHFKCGKKYVFAKYTLFAYLI